MKGEEKKSAGNDGNKKKRNTKCKVCASGYVDEVDRMLVMGYTMEHIAGWLTEHGGGKKYSRQNVFEHRNRHLSLESDILRKVYEQRENKDRSFFDKMVDFTQDVQIHMEQFIKSGFLKFANGEVEITASDWLRAVQIYSKDMVDLERFNQMYSERLMEWALALELFKSEMSENDFDYVMKAWEFAINAPGRPNNIIKQILFSKGAMINKVRNEEVLNLLGMKPPSLSRPSKGYSSKGKSKKDVVENGKSKKDSTEGSKSKKDSAEKGNNPGDKNGK